MSTLTSDSVHMLADLIIAEARRDLINFERVAIIAEILLAITKERAKPADEIIGRRLTYCMTGNTIQCKAPSRSFGRTSSRMMKTIHNPGFDPSQEAVVTISMSCIEWDQLGNALAGMPGQVFQTTANAIRQALREVGYFKQAPLRS